MSLADIQQLLAGSGWLAAIILLAMTFVEVIPIKINPWSKLAGAVGKAINKDVMSKLEQVEAAQRQTQAKLDESIRVNDDRNADAHRERILRFNLEVMRKEKHTREDFLEVLAEIDAYEHYCKDHPDYPNNRAVHAVNNIERVYDDLLENGGFFEPDKK